MKRIARPLIYGGLFCLIAITLTYFLVDPPLMQKLRGRATVSDRLAQFGPAAQERWEPYFDKKQIAYPPSNTNPTN